MKHILLVFALFSSLATFAQEPKITTIKYKDHTVVTGLTIQKQFVNGSICLSFPNNSILKGDLSIENGEYLVDGDLFLPGNYIKGRFLLQNSPQNLSTKKSDINWNIKMIDAKKFRLTYNEIEFSGKEGGNGKYVVTVSKLPDQNIDRIVFPSEKDIITQNHNISIAYVYDLLLKQEGNIFVVTKRGDSFQGNIKFNDGSRIEILNGSCKYANGDYFKGEFDDPLLLPKKGVLKYSDGTEATNLSSGYFWKNLDSDRISEIWSTDAAPSKLRDEDTRILNERIAEEKKMEAERKIEKHKADSVAHVEQTALALKQKREAQKKNKLIAKYGKKYGTLIYQKKPEMGMTTQMINDIWPKGAFYITRSVYASTTVESWVFSKDKLSQYLVKEIRNAGGTQEDVMEALFSLNLAMELSGGVSNIPNMVFTNNQLTSISYW